jgi:DNA polymerase I-like protein with 3'-5' exonuclease and polymerase domains
MNNMAAYEFMKAANALSVPKVLQNGKYDCAYFFAYSVPLTAYYYDLKNAMHAQYAELPKDLAFSSALWLRDIMYWKDLSSSGDAQDKFRYGALDTWATGEAFISWMQQAPQWAKDNYITEFQLVPALHMCEMLGIKRDEVALNKAAAIGADELAVKLQICQTYVGTPKFNPSSPLQCKKLICALTGTKYVPDVKKVKDMTWQEKNERQKADKKAIEKASYQHPLNERVLGSILEYRQLRKKLSTYLVVGEDAKEFNGRTLYSLNPDGRDSGRLASGGLHLWTGVNMQNMEGSRDIYVR